MANEPQAAENPREAGAPRTTGPTRTYEGDRIRVLWDAGRGASQNKPFCDNSHRLIGFRG